MIYGRPLNLARLRLSPREPDPAPSTAARFPATGAASAKRPASPPRCPRPRPHAHALGESVLTQEAGPARTAARNCHSRRRQPAPRLASRRLKLAGLASRLAPRGQSSRFEQGLIRNDARRDPDHHSSLSLSRVRCQPRIELLSPGEKNISQAYHTPASHPDALLWRRLCNPARPHCLSRRAHCALAGNCRDLRQYHPHSLTCF